MPVTKACAFRNDDDVMGVGNQLDLVPTADPKLLLGDDDDADGGSATANPSLPARIRLLAAGLVTIGATGMVWVTWCMSWSSLAPILRWWAPRMSSVQRPMLTAVPIAN